MIKSFPPVILGSSPFTNSPQLKKDYTCFENNPDAIYQVLVMAVRCGCVGFHCFPDVVVVDVFKKLKLDYPHIVIIGTIGFGGKLMEQVENLSILQVDGIMLHSSIVDVAPTKYLAAIYNLLNDRNISLGFSTNNILQSRILFDYGFSFAMTPINMMGYHMEPSREEVLDLLPHIKETIIGMQVIASGRLDWKTAILWASRHVRHMVLGIGNPDNVNKSISYAMACLKD